MTIIWHNPRCTKSREALRLLEEAGRNPTVRLYLTEPPTIEELAQARDLMGLHTIEMVRVDEPAFRDLDLADGPDEALLEAMAANPILIERPIVFVGAKAVIARPPEKVKAIL